MAPGQAAGDPTTDHRTDIYAWYLVGSTCSWSIGGRMHPDARCRRMVWLLARALQNAHFLVEATAQDIPLLLQVKLGLQVDPELVTSPKISR